MAGTVPTYRVTVDFGAGGGGATNIGAGGSNDVLVEGMTIRRGIEGSGPWDLTASTGIASFVLDNSASNSAATLGYYSLYHASKRAGWNLGITCVITMVDPTDASVHTMFTGRIDAIDPIPGVKRERYVRVTAVDWLNEAALWMLTPDIGEQTMKRAEELLNSIISWMPFPPAVMVFDGGSEAYPIALDTSGQQPALAEFAKIAASGADLIYLKADGTLRQENRHTRLLDTVSDWTLANADLVSLELPSTRAEILNTVRVTYHPKVVDATPTTIVYDQAEPIFVAAGTTKTLTGQYQDPETGDPIGAFDVQAQGQFVDYVANTQEDGNGTSLTASFVVVVTAGAADATFVVTNNSATNGYLVLNRLFGRGVYDRGSVTVEASDATSVTTYGEHVVLFDMPYQANNDVAQGAANYFLAKFKDPLAQVRRLTVVGDTTTILSQILLRDISDRLTVSETVTGVNKSFFINGLELTVLPTRHLQATYTLAPSQDPFADVSGNPLYWILGTSVLGSSTIPAPF